MAQKNLDGYGSVVSIAGSSEEPRKEKGDERPRYGEMIWRLYMRSWPEISEKYI